MVVNFSPAFRLPGSVRPTTSSAPNRRFAAVTLTMAIWGAFAPSAAEKSRPLTKGIPNALKYCGVGFSIPMSRWTGRPVQRDIGMLNPTPQYFSALGIPLVRGRLFSAADGANAPQIAIVNVTAAKRLFGALDVVGRTLPGSRKAGEKFTTIVGVVGDVKYSGLGEAVGETVYVPFPQYPFRNMML